MLGAWADAAPGRGSTWFVCADGGGGKTAFLHSILPKTVAEISGRTAPGAQHEVFWGDAEPLSPPEPYLAIARAIPGFRPGGAPAANVARALDTLRGHAAGRRIAIVLDDLHFADEGTIAVARRIAVESRAMGWLVLLALRPSEGSRALGEMAAELVGHGRATRLDLPELTHAGVATLARQLRGTTITDAEITRLFTDSGGNPWFVEALARGDASLSAANQHLQVRLTRLQRELPGALPVLNALAVATRPVAFGVVATICGGDTPTLRGLLHDLRAASILNETDDAWRLRQEMMRRAILAAMIPADRRDAHRRLAQALEREGRAAELAMHYAAADDPRAGTWALRAAREAIDLEAHAEAYAQLERALAGELDAPSRLHAFELAATEASALFRIQEPIEFAKQGLALAGDDPAATLRLATSLALTLHWRGEVEAAERYWQQAAGAAGHFTRAADLALMHAWRGLCAIVSEQPLAAGAAVAASRAALPAANASKAAHLAAALADMAEALARLTVGDAGAAADATTALERLRTVGLVPWTMALAAFGATTLVALELDAVDAAIAALGAVLERRQVGLRLTNNAFAAFAAVQRGDLAPVRVPDPRGTPLPPRSGVAGRLLAVHALREIRAGNLAGVADMLGPAPTPARRPLAGASLDIARLEYLALTDPAALRECAQAMHDTCMASHHARGCGEAAVHLARSGIAVTRPDWLPAGSRLALFWDWATAIGGADAPALRNVADALVKLGCPYEAAVALLDAGDLNEAYRRLRALDATNLRDRIASRMRLAHLPVPRRTRAAVAADGLTDSEREVCVLIVQAMRNRDIAERLCISVRTVETHLSNLYRKTGTNNRNALARWWSGRAGAA